MATSTQGDVTSTVGDAITGFHGVRYIVTDVKRAVEFYTRQLGFTLEHQHLPEFATVRFGDLQLHLSGPGASGSRPLSPGQDQKPGGSNRIVLRVRELAPVIDALRATGASFRGDMQAGPGGKQIQVVDPDGNPVELFEPARRE